MREAAIMSEKSPSGPIDIPRKVRYRWSHRHPLHRAVVRAANRVLPMIPFSAKYGLTDLFRRRRLPYRLLGSSAVAIQVGAPRDTLLAGRSRGMTFARLTKAGGRVLIVEPDPSSAQEFRRIAARQGLSHVDVVNVAAWSECAELTIRVDDRHPATNFTAGSADYDQNELIRFHETAVQGVTLDELIETMGIGRVDLVSITTNGAEEDVLCGLRRTLARDRPYISLARTRTVLPEVMRELDYDYVGQDDRGFTFQHRG
jgi:FkbM family methyltransferase